MNGFLAAVLVGCPLAAGGSSIRCAGWGSTPLRTLPSSAINDGYCDCPHDGADEVETGACAGSVDGGWAGIPASPAAAAAATDNTANAAYFQCPQQVKLKLPLSRLSDGICDCCDGADEAAGQCADVCDEVLAAERAEAAKAAAAYAEGSRKRSEEMAEFATLLQETVSEIEQLRKDELPVLQTKANALDAAVQEAKDRYVAERVAAVQQISDFIAHIAEVATLDEIRTFLITACQMSGEVLGAFEDGDADNGSKLNRSRSNKNTCVALRLAGLDVGILWEDEILDEEGGFSATVRRSKDEDGAVLPEIADLLIQNGKDTSGFVTFGKDDTSPGNKARGGHRYLSRDRPPPDYGDDDYHDYHDDDYVDDEDEYYHHDDSAETEDDDAPGDGSGGAGVGTETDDEDARQKRRDIIRVMISSTQLASSRAAFVTQARSLIDDLDELLKEEPDNASEEEEGDGSTEIDGEDKDNDGAFDPQAIQMLRQKIDSRLKQVEKGYQFSLSAALLLDTLQDVVGYDPDALKRDMTDLAIMTIYHSQLSAGDVADLFHLSMMRPATSTASDQEEETCYFMYNALCPPTTVKRSNDVTLPPHILNDPAKARCDERMPLAATVCSPPDPSSVSTSVQDGLFGYFTPKLREENDPLESVLEPFSTVSSYLANVSAKEAEKRTCDSELTQLHSKISALEDKIGGRDKPKFGATGELYGIRDECVTVESGKYEYELCMFKKSHQRDKGQTSGGTFLGNWAGMTRDEETGQRVMQWVDGTKCWNGPKRSATAFVTCGAETKLLTANEPSTCEYVFTMESHIACDDAYKQEHGL